MLQGRRDALLASPWPKARAWAATVVASDEKRAAEAPNSGIERVCIHIRNRGQIKVNAQIEEFLAKVFRNFTHFLDRLLAHALCAGQIHKSLRWLLRRRTWPPSWSTAIKQGARLRT